MDRIYADPPTTQALEEIKALRRMQGEAGLVLEFRTLADRVGLAIPEDSARLRSWRHLASILGAHPAATFGANIPLKPERRWPQAELLSAVALAQHYGVPTRLLDWTWKPRVAAYFAARDVMLHEHEGALAVWALRADLIDLAWAMPANDPDVEVVHAPQASNPNLEAQAGLFTVARHVHEDAGLEEVIVDKLAEWPGLLHKMRLPVSEAPALMKRLWFEDVTAATVFPGYGGVVAALHEKDWFFQTK